MDVSRIEAVPIRQIEWRKLTANQIIKYENLGLDIPSQYLQWAKEFLNDVNSAQKDEITYEMAMESVSQNVQNSVSGEINDNNAIDENVTDNPQPLTAKEKRKQLEDNGESILSIADEFKKESDSRKGASDNGVGITEQTENSSNDEISVLESNMQELMSNCNDIRSKIDTEKRKKNKNMSTILRLQQQLKSIGKEAQTMLLQGGLDMESYNQIFNNQNIIAGDAVDYGNETSDIGNEVKHIMYLYGYGRRVEKSGEQAIKSGETLGQKALEALNTNDANIDKITNFKNQVKLASGVGAISANNDKNDDTSDNSKSTQDVSRTAAITETDKAASATLDQILQAKIRKGEELNT